VSANDTTQEQQVDLRTREGKDLNTRLQRVEQGLAELLERFEQQPAPSETPASNDDAPVDTDRLGRIEEAIGELTHLITRYAPIPGGYAEHVRAILGEHNIRVAARDAEKTTRLREIEAERRKLTGRG
jgi:hypothetical protein